MSVESASSSVVCSVPSIYSDSSFADTIPLSTPTSYSLDTIPSDFSFLDSRLMTIGDIGSVSPEVPQVFYDAFAEESVAEDLLTPPTYLETITQPTLELINIVDLPNIEPQSSDVEQINYSIEPEIGQIEAETRELSDFGLPTTAEELITEVQEITAPTFVIPSEVEDQAWESTKIMEDCRVADVPRNDMVEEVQEISTQTFVIPAPEPESKSDSSQASLIQIKDGSRIKSGMTGNYDEISESTLVKAVNELEKLAEVPVTITLPEASAEVETVSEVISSEQLANPEVAQIIQTNSEMMQATKTYQAFVTAGVEKAVAVELVENALIEAEIEPEAVKQIMLSVRTEQRVKVEPAYAKASAGKEEEEKKKKRRYKFIKDKIALAHIFKAWKKAVESAPIKKEAGKDMIDSIDALALMPTEVQNSGVKSGMLPRYILEWLNFGDGAYRTALAMVKDIGLRSRQDILERGFALHRKLPPVTIAEEGEEAGKADVERVFTHKPSPVINNRRLTVYS